MTDLMNRYTGPADRLQSKGAAGDFRRMLPKVVNVLMYSFTTV
jgi:hypothetical protein